MPNGRQSQRVIIADSCAPRVKFLTGVLLEEYDITPDIVDEWDGLLGHLKPPGAHSMPLDRQAALVIMNESLPGHVGLASDRVPALLALLAPRGQLVFIREDPSSIVWPRTGLHVLTTNAVKDWQVKPDRLAQALEDCLGPPRPRTVVSLVPADDRILIEMIRSLGRDGDLERGEKVLSALVRDLWKLPTAQVRRLTQGYSGAKVLRCDLDSAGSPDSFALKISSGNDVWKIGNELEKWAEIERELDLHGLKRFVPQLVVPHIPSDANPRWVSSGGFNAVAYQFLGAAAGTFLNLQDAYVFPLAELQRVTRGTRSGTYATRLANFILEQVIDCLGHAWYQDAQVATDEPLWSAEDAASKKVLQPPPYKLTSWQKAHLLGCLETFEKVTRLGPRMLKDAWPASRLVTDWLKAKPGDGLIPASPQAAVVSPVHGDLNSQNILLWVDQAQPFLIDFACYQSRGHTFQDFARLETEVKFVLMEQESDSPLRAMDYTESQFEAWCSLEHELASADWADNPSLGENSPSVKRAVEMIRFVRHEARKVHDNAFRANPTTDSTFLLEYFAALLYHTLQTIGYESLSPFKRLLAVHSAVQLIHFLQVK